MHELASLTTSDELMARKRTERMTGQQNYIIIIPVITDYHYHTNVDWLITVTRNANGVPRKLVPARIVRFQKGQLRHCRSRHFGWLQDFWHMIAVYRTTPTRNVRLKN